MSGYHNAFGYGTTRYFGAGVDGDPDAGKFITAGGITDPVQKKAIEAFVKATKSAGVYSKFYCCYLCVGGTALAHKLNLVNPQDTDAAFRLTFGVSVTHGPNGVNTAVASPLGGDTDTHMIPSDAWPLSSPNFAAGILCHTAPDQNSIPGGNYLGGTGASAATNTPRFTRGTVATEFTCGINGNNRIISGISLTSFFAVTNQFPSAQIYMDGVANGAVLSTNTMGTSGNRSMHIGRYNNDGTIQGTCTFTWKFAFWSQPLSAQEHLDLRNAVVALQTALGR